MSILNSITMKKLLILFFLLGVTTLGFAQTRPHLFNITGRPYANVKEYGAVGDGTTDDTECLRSAFSSGKNVYIPAGVYLVDATAYSSTPALPGIEVASGTHVWGEMGATLKVIPNAQDYYRVLYARNASNIIIENITLIGDRDTHAGTTGQQGHGIWLMSVENVSLRNIITKDFWGDGVYIGESGSDGPSSRITVDGLVTTNNRRQGLTISSAAGVSISNSTFSKMQGSEPETGIDLEPYEDWHVLNNIQIVNCVFEDNEKDFILSNAKASDTSVLIDNCVFSDSRSNIIVIGNASASGFVGIKNSVIRDTKYSALTFRDMMDTTPFYASLNNVVTYDCGWGMLGITKGGRVLNVYRSTTGVVDSATPIGNLHIDGLKVVRTAEWEAKRANQEYTPLRDYFDMSVEPPLGNVEFERIYPFNSIYFVPSVDFVQGNRFPTLSQDTIAYSHTAPAVDNTGATGTLNLPRSGSTPWIPSLVLGNLSKNLVITLLTTGIGSNTPPIELLHRPTSSTSSYTTDITTEDGSWIGPVYSASVRVGTRQISGQRVKIQRINGTWMLDAGGTAELVATPE